MQGRRDYKSLTDLEDKKPERQLKGWLRRKMEKRKEKKRAKQDPYFDEETYELDIRKTSKSIERMKKKLEEKDPLYAYLWLDRNRKDYRKRVKSLLKKHRLHHGFSRLNEEMEGDNGKAE